MKKLLAAGAVAALVLLGGAMPAQAVPNLCPAGDSGKIDVSSEDSSITLTAPAGQVITQVCLKSGTTVEYFTFDPGQQTVTVTTTSGKDISHYSVWYGEGGYES